MKVLKMGALGGAVMLVVSLAPAPTAHAQERDTLLRAFDIGRGARIGASVDTSDADAGKDAKPVDLKAVAPYLGYYEGGYSLVREGRDLQLRIGPRVFPLQVTPDGSYVMSAGFMVGVGVKLALERDGTPHVEIVGVETVRRNTG